MGNPQTQKVGGEQVDGGPALWEGLLHPDRGLGELRPVRDPKDAGLSPGPLLVSPRQRLLKSLVQFLTR